MDSKGDGRHFFRVCFWLCFPLVLGLCMWWFAVVQAAGVDALAVLWSGSRRGEGNVVTIVFTWLATIVFMDSKGDGRHFFRVCFWLCFPLVLGLCMWWFAVVQAAGVDALAVLWSGSRRGEGNVVTIVFTWLATIVFMDSKGDGRHFFRVCFWLCFPLVLGLCMWWFAVVQAAGVDALAVLWSGSRRGEGNVVTIVFTWLVIIVFMDSKGDGRHFFRVCFWLCFPLVLVCCSAGGWFGRFGCALIWVLSWWG